MVDRSRWHQLRILLAPTASTAAAFAQPRHALRNTTRGSVVTCARATRIEATITAAESELLRKRARRIVAGSRRRLRELGVDRGHWAAA